MTDSVDTDALRGIAEREDRESDTFIDGDFADERYWELREVADAIRVAAGEIDALRARAERAEAVIAEVGEYRRMIAESGDLGWHGVMITDDLKMILSRASQPASEVEQ